MRESKRSVSGRYTIALNDWARSDGLLPESRVDKVIEGFRNWYDQLDPLTQGEYIAITKTRSGKERGMARASLQCTPDGAEILSRTMHDLGIASLTAEDGRVVRPTSFPVEKLKARRQPPRPAGTAAAAFAKTPPPVPAAAKKGSAVAMAPPKPKRTGRSRLDTPPIH
jgi:hypothetical protein